MKSRKRAVDGKKRKKTQRQIDKRKE